MKLLVVTARQNQYTFETVCKSVVGDKIFCGYDVALEQLLVEEPTHVLIDFDGVHMEATGKAKEKAQSILRDLRQSASADQKVLVTSFQRHADIGGDVETKDFLRLPYTAQQLEAFLTGAA